MPPHLCIYSAFFKSLSVNVTCPPRHRCDWPQGFLPTYLFFRLVLPRAAEPETRPSVTANQLLCAVFGLNAVSHSVVECVWVCFFFVVAKIAFIL